MVEAVGEWSMNDNEWSWDDGFEGAWKTFRQELAHEVAGLGEGEVVCVDVMTTTTEGEGVPPYIQFLVDVDGEAVRGEVSSNFWMDAEHQLDAEQTDLLTEIGWVTPELEAGRPAGIEAANYHAEGADGEWLVVMAVRALREVFGVVHPSFLETSYDGEEVDDDEQGIDVDEEPISHPTCRAELQERVDVALTPAFEHPPSKDEDGDIPIVTGDSVIFVRVAHDEPAVELFAVLVTDIKHAERALSEVNLLNRRAVGLTYSLNDDRVLVRRRVSGQPFVAQQLRDALHTMLSELDEVAGDLVARVGGLKFREISEPEEQPEQPERPRRVAQPSRTWMQTLAHLEDDQPGSVDAELAAHIFHLDQVAILGQITRQRRAGRPDLVALLTGALRIVVEGDAQRRTPA